MFLIFWAAGTWRMPELPQSFPNVCVWINVTISFLFMFLIQNPASIDNSDFILIIIMIIPLPYPSLQAFLCK